MNTEATLSWPRSRAVPAGLVLIGLAGAVWISLPAEKPEERAGAEPGLPVGAIVAFGGPPAAVPEREGWLLCDGRELSTQEYARLFQAIQYAWGRGVRAGTFRLPDLRGRFLRGLDLTSEGRDPDGGDRVAAYPGGNAGNQVGSIQEDALRLHSHALSGASRTAGIPEADSGWVRFYASAIEGENAPPVVDETSVLGAGGAETRPKNAAVHWIIRVR